MHAAGEALNISHVRRTHPALLAAVYAVKPFWGWKCALDDSGIDYSKINVELEDHVECRVCGLRMSTLRVHLRTVHGMTVDGYHADHPHAPIFSEAFSVKLSRLTRQLIPHWERGWSPEYALDRLYELHRRGFRLNPKLLMKKEISTYTWVKVFFREWDVALRAIGLDPAAERMSARGRRWTRQEVIAALQRRHAQGKEINYGALENQESSLLSATTRMFGSHDKALRAAGFDPAKIRTKSPVYRYRLPSQVVDAICRRKLEGKPLNPKALCVGEHKDTSLHDRAYKLFGTWQRAVEAAGLDYSTIVKAGHRYNDQPSIIKEIRRRHQAGITVAASGVRSLDPHKDTALIDHAKTHFGSWKAAVRAAGIDYAAVAPKRKIRYPTRESALDELKARHARGESVASGDIAKGAKRDPALYVTVMRHFGGVAAACREAGVDYGPVRRCPRIFQSKDAVLAEIARRHRAGQPMNAAAIQRSPNHGGPLYRTAVKDFGSWADSLKIAGVRQD